MIVSTKQARHPAGLLFFLFPFINLAQRKKNKSFGGHIKLTRTGNTISSKTPHAHANEMKTFTLLALLVVFGKHIFQSFHPRTRQFPLFSSVSIDRITSEKVSCRCGEKPWTSRDLGGTKGPTLQCCQYFLESGEGDFSEDVALCNIENEFIYKRFHSCCVQLLKSAYCKMQKDGGQGKTSKRAFQLPEDPWGLFNR